MDLLLQTSTQSHCNRIVKYFDQRDQLHVFPAGPFADAAEELGPVIGHNAGPCLVLFSNIQLAPQQFNSWLSGSFMERPCCRVYWLERAIPAQPDRQALVQSVVAADVPEGLTAVRLDVYPKRIEAQLGDELYTAGFTVPLHPAAYSHVLFVVQMPDSGLWRWSYMDRNHLWRHSPDQPARFSKSVATAINKIAEAMDVLGLRQQHASHCQNSHHHGLQDVKPIAEATHQQQLQQQLHVDAAAPADPAVQQSSQHNSCGCSSSSSIADPTRQQQQQSLREQEQQEQPQRWAIDVGACPGGWTSYLTDSCGYSVIAIDPAELHPDVTARPGVHFIKARAADALEQMDELLQGQQADLLVCDANDHVTCLPKFLGPVLPRLRSGGWLVLTLKFYGRGSKDGVAEKLALLLPELEPGTCLWLLANTLCERTYVARKR